ncbi:hypothetical protein F7725_004947 [Dissostichus mawsoni]|uniref:SH3 domain-containing protein n=1 Tax=Dissostichus mawsoni TaxID=36200 RepID=A0A7J5XKX4_DISMA|nr:hypothetical protein F7725_004947 [Dissostichus mawsoni]
MTLSVKGKSAALCICVFERCSSLQQSKHLEVLKTPDDCSRIPQQPITAPLPGCSWPIGRLDGTQEVQSEFIETERDWRQRRRTQKRGSSSSSLSSLSSLSSRLASTITIATQTDPGSAPDPQGERKFNYFLRPKPRSRLSAPPPISSEVRVQTLVKLRDDGAATLAARTGSDPAKQEVSQGKYLQELLEAFSSDDWGFPDRRSNSGSQSESEEEEEEGEDDMAALKARIQAFEQQQQLWRFSPTKRPETRPEPKPRPRLEKNKSAPPTVAPKPKNVAQAAKPSCKRFWEEVAETDLTPEPDSCVLKSEPVVVPVKNTEKPSISPKPQTTTDPPPPSAGPVPAPRPPPHPKLTPSVSETQAKPPPRPPVAPRASVGAPPQEKSSSAGQRTPTLPPDPLWSSAVDLTLRQNPSEDQSDEGKSQTAVIDQSQSLLDLDSQPEPAPDQESQSKSDLEGLSLSDSQSSEQKEQLNPPPVSGPRCVALFDYEGEEEDELTFSQGDVIALLELIGQDWGRGQIHGRIGIFPLNFAEVEWVEALFDFPGQTAEDLSFQQGALILVMEHIDADWRRGKLGGKEGVYPAAFTQPCNAQPITGQQAEVGDVITQVEFVDEQWILGDVGGKRGIVPKNYISLL